MINFESLLPTADRVKGATQNILNHLFFVSKAFIPNLRPLVPFLLVEKLVVVLVGRLVGGKC